MNLPPNPEFGVAMDKISEAKATIRAHKKAVKKANEQKLADYEILREEIWKEMESNNDVAYSYRMIAGRVIAFDKKYPKNGN